ncbi:N-methyl-D-aspartate receptor NMDAR2C subunit [Mitsuaria sp. GD03876]|uniref:HD domain-containing protein n=1 Tax=Mitsuaria sp. GD03876 TaxID=2975399 RepID=UPI0024474658|nr:N-methyl-D-aspartate receptor NMDAR2C subunit [Mitsuaria sp. GD03876]MDH0865829.1 N-methyl-D-aspartate receptor NMDAR2C subunit [Mitsuaria sp. GD03876]
MNDLFERSWQRAWSALAGDADGIALRDELLARYAEPQRKYHTRQHLAECLALFEEAATLAPHPAEVEMALWFHDAIYEVKGSGNEDRSAEWAHRALLDAGVAEACAALVRQLVLVTKHDGVPVSADEQVLVDIDLAILGAERPRFDEYERQIRDEYGYVPGFLFRRKRKQILKTFLDRPVLYSTAVLRERLETRARENLKRAIG